MALTNVDGHYPICREPQWNKRQKFWVRHPSSPALKYISTRHSQAFGSGLNYNTRFPGSPACRQHIMQLLSPYNHVSQSYNKSTLMLLSLFLSLYLYILSVLFLCKTLTNTTTKTKVIHPVSFKYREHLLIH